jgi:hypothetical protein
VDVLVADINTHVEVFRNVPAKLLVNLERKKERSGRKRGKE